MYFYISFLRPPPTAVSPSARTIAITPQVANDLRTEPFPDAIDLYYAWAPTSPALRATRPAKLTTWTTTSAYKEITIGVPSGVRNGQAWTLVLTSAPSAGPRIVLSDAGSAPFPVLSMPIDFTTRASTAPVKQERIRRVLSMGANMDITITEQTSFDLDKKLWDSGIGLSSWVADLFRVEVHEDLLAEKMSGLLRRKTSITVVELGAGTGIASIALASLRGTMSSDSSDDPDTILTTDLESAMPLLNEIIAKNARLATRGVPEALVLDWDEPALPTPVLVTQQRGLDLILMADVTYNTAAFPALVRTLCALLRGPGRRPMALLGFKERDPDERTLWPMLADAAGLTLKKVGERSGAGGAPVEIWIGTVSNSTSTE